MYLTAAVTFPRPAKSTQISECGKAAVSKNIWRKETVPSTSFSLCPSAGSQTTTPVWAMAEWGEQPRSFATCPSSFISWADSAVLLCDIQACADGRDWVKYLFHHHTGYSSLLLLLLATTLHFLLFVQRVVTFWPLLQPPLTQHVSLAEVGGSN